MSSLLRIVDATANRAAEALRTLEDLDRFVGGGLGDGAAKELRELRHELRRVVAEVEPLSRLFHRDAIGDPGSPVQPSTESSANPGATVGQSRRDAHDRAAVGQSRREAPDRAAVGQSRRDAVDIAAAASSRLGEALRSLEECLRVIKPDAAVSIERLRFRGYDASARVERMLGTGRARQWRVCLLLTESLCVRPWREVLRGAVDAGAECVQVREKELNDHALLQRVREVIEIVRPRGATVIVNDRADVALAAGADGVHLGQGDLPIGAARRLGGPLIVGSSTHDLAEARAAVEAGADYCGVGAMFATALKPEREPGGERALREFIAAHPSVPHLAIGGITPERMPTLIAAGCRGVAVSAAICGAEDPGAVTTRLIEAFGAAAPTTAASTIPARTGAHASSDREPRP